MYIYVYIYIYIYPPVSCRGGDEAAALGLKLVPKVMKEAQQLCAQLGGMLEQIFPDDEPEKDTAEEVSTKYLSPVKPPDSKQVTIA